MELICPFAIQTYKHDTKGPYLTNYPVGAVIHFTAGQCDTEQDAIDSIKWGRDNGYTFWMIGPTGVLYQTSPVNEWGYHCGKSANKRLGEGLSNQLIGIEISCAGLLDSEGISWFGKKYPKGDCRYVDGKVHGCDSGNYKKYRVAQEETLIMLLRWLKYNNPDVFNFDNVLGHYEVSPGRKFDPGGSLSCSMEELRKQLKAFPLAPVKPEDPKEVPVEKVDPKIDSWWRLIKDLLSSFWTYLRSKR